MLLSLIGECLYPSKRTEEIYLTAQDNFFSVFVTGDFFRRQDNQLARALAFMFGYVYCSCDQYELIRKYVQSSDTTFPVLSLVAWLA